jgi:hypothetical protein
MPVIAFAYLIVEPKYASPVGHVGQSVLERVITPWKWLRQLPDHYFDEGATAMTFLDVVSLVRGA